MSLEQQLKDLNDHPHDGIANWAADAYQLAEDFKFGKITKIEYAELLEDLKHSQAITDAAADQAALSQMHAILQGLKTIGSLV
jgi:hypothetical protein